MRPIHIKIYKRICKKHIRNLSVSVNSSTNTVSIQALHPEYIVGLTDAEGGGSFMIIIRKNTQRSWGIDSTLTG